MAVLLGGAIVAIVFSLPGQIPSGAEPAPKGDLPSRYDFSPGRRTVHLLNFIGSATTDLDKTVSGSGKPGTVRGAPKRLELRAHGELIVVALGRRATSVDLALRLANHRVSIETGRGRSTASDEVQADLKRWWFLEVDERGRIETVRFAPDVSRIGRHVARQILSAIQFVTGADTASSWEVVEESLHGRYLVRYRATRTSPRLLRVVKTRLELPARAEESTGGSSETVVLARMKPEGRTVVLFDPAIGAVRSLEGSELQIITLTGSIAGTSRIEARLGLVTHGHCNEEELEALARTARRLRAAVKGRGLWAMPTPEEMEDILARTELGKLTAEQVLRALEAAEKKGSELKKDPLYEKVKALVHLRPEACRALGNLLLRADPAGTIMKMVPLALGTVGSPRAQEALAAAIGARARDRKALEVLVPALGLVSRPTPASLRALEDLYRRAPSWDVASTAALSLGIMARNLARAKPDLSRRVTADVVAELERRADERQKATLLSVLGNVGGPGVAAPLASFASHRSPLLRARAVEALRWVPGERIDSLLTRRLTSDPEGQVRYAAAEALGYRKTSPAVLEAQIGAYGREAESIVRLQILRNLHKHGRDLEEARRLLEEAAEEDADADVRKGVRRMQGKG